MTKESNKRNGAYALTTTMPQGGKKPAFSPLRRVQIGVQLAATGQRYLAMVSNVHSRVLASFKDAE